MGEAMNAKCNQCSFAELQITGELLNIGEYFCSVGCNMQDSACKEFKLDIVNEDFEFSYAS
jgi:hypothetical protein